MKIIPSSIPGVNGRKEFERFEALMRDVASGFAPAGAIVEVNLIGERRMAGLNRKYRDRRGATEILTFSYAGEHGGWHGVESPIGEIYFCWRKLAIGAEERGVTKKAYLLRLLVHGLCHLKGYRHRDGDETGRMEKVERRYLAGHVSKRQIEVLFA